MHYLFTPPPLTTHKFVFSSCTDMDEHVEKIVKQFAMTNSSPYTCVRMLQMMDDHLYDVQTIVNIFNKANTFC
jgi:hypothetical protein